MTLIRQMTGGRKKKKTTKVSAGKRTIRDAELGLDGRGWGEQKGSLLGKLAEVMRPRPMGPSANPVPPGN